MVSLEKSLTNGLTDTERNILCSLADAWNSFCELPNRSESDDEEFCLAIHTAQAKIALRVARRIDPGIWNQHYDH